MALLVYYAKRILKKFYQMVEINSQESLYKVFQLMGWTFFIAMCKYMDYNQYIG